jgi:hypothetical protein
MIYLGIRGVTEAHFSLETRRYYEDVNICILATIKPTYHVSKLKYNTSLIQSSRPSYPPITAREQGGKNEKTHTHTHTNRPFRTQTDIIPCFPVTPSLPAEIKYVRLTKTHKRLDLPTPWGKKGSTLNFLTISHQPCPLQQPCR